MALTASVDVGFNGNYGVESAAARGLKFVLGRITGTYGGALTTLSIPGLANPLFVTIPPQSNYVFAWGGSSTSNFSVIIQGASASNSVMASSPTSIDLASFQMVWNGAATTGLPFFAVGWG